VAAGRVSSRGSYSQSEGGDSENDCVEVDGITTIQSALSSHAYTKKIQNVFRTMREDNDIKCRHMHLHHVDSFYDKMDSQNILKGERKLVRS